jgi:RimJ/RimL family protein N-acetyltransferase
MAHADPVHDLAEEKARVSQPDRIARMSPDQTRSSDLWQPTLRGEGFVASPLQESDFESLFAAAADPGIWAMHPVRDRWQRDPFTIYFRSGLESRGALVFRDPRSGEVIGSSRFCAHDPAQRRVEIGYTFLVRKCWGSGLNSKIKAAMLAHAFRHVDAVEFVIGPQNLRSRRAVEKLGAVLVRTLVEQKPEGDVRESVVYELNRAAWSGAKVAR